MTYKIKKYYFKGLAAILIFGFLAAVLSSVQPVAANREHGQIREYKQTMLLVFELTNNQVKLHKTTKINKKFSLKKEAQIKNKLAKLEAGHTEIGLNKIKFEVITKQNEVLYADLVSAPTLWHYDYINQEGDLAGGTVQKDSVFFTVKAPYVKGIKSIKFAQPTPTGSENLGSVDLDGLFEQDEIADSQSISYPAVKIVDKGDSADKIDIVLMGDGYRDFEISSTFHTNVNEFITGFNSAEPFSQYQDVFNIWHIDVISQESGADHPCDSIYKNTALDARYGNCDIPHLLTANQSKVFDAADSVIQAGW